MLLHRGNLEWPMSPWGQTLPRRFSSGAVGVPPEAAPPIGCHRAVEGHFLPHAPAAKAVSHFAIGPG
jgi:hypothetical protein